MRITNAQVTQQLLTSKFASLQKQVENADTFAKLFEVRKQVRQAEVENKISTQQYLTLMPRITDKLLEIAND